MTLVHILVSLFVLRLFSPRPVFSTSLDRFTHLVDSPIGMERFRALYHIPQDISLQYCPSGEWLTHRREGEVVIPMIAFIEGGMRLPMGRMTRDFLRAHRICPQ